MPIIREHRRAWLTWVVTLAGVAAIAAVAYDGHRAVRAAHRPFDIDQYRDIAAAQSFADGRLLRDPFYPRETLWYNPLLPAVVALAATVRHADVADTYVQLGPFLNMLGPLAFFAMAVTLFGRMPAFLALMSLLFGPPHGDPAWTTPTLSPWMFPATFATAFFYIGIVICSIAAARRRDWQWTALGAWIGLTFLAHAAPALILGICAMTAIWLTPIEPRPRQAGTPLRASALVISAAAVVSSPLLWSIAWHYHFHVLNAAPNDWAWLALDTSHVAGTIRSWLSPWLVLPVVAFALLIQQSGRSIHARIVLAWVGGAAALLGYAVARQTMGALPPLVPGFHFYLYLRAAGHLLTGVAVWYLLCAAAAALFRLLPPLEIAGEPVAIVAALAVAAAFVSANLSGYRQRPGFHHERAAAEDMTSNETSTRVTTRLRQETPRDAVVLARADDSILLVAPAGRSVVAVPREFSNPYVDVDKRLRDQQSMLLEFSRNDAVSLRTLAAEYGVTHVLLREEKPGDGVPVLPPGARLISWQGNLSVYALAP